MNHYQLPEILVLSSYPPRECGIATYTQDLIKALRSKFNTSFEVKVCALNNDVENHIYNDDVKYELNTSNAESYRKLANKINADSHIEMLMIQHEFGFFRGMENELEQFIESVHKPVAITFHTVLPNPNNDLKLSTQNLVHYCDSVVVMTNNAAEILQRDYLVDPDMIQVISHGTHLIDYTDKEKLKYKWCMNDRIILSTFGLISSGKSIETTINALPEIIKLHPSVLFLVIGKTHPTVVKEEGERYRVYLEHLVLEAGIQEHVHFLNYYIPLDELLELLQMTDIYLFTSKDPNQAVSGTFSYAMSCGCPIISTPIPHALEILGKDKGLFFEFENTPQLAELIMELLSSEEKQSALRSNGLHQIISTAWENVSLSHAEIFKSMADAQLPIELNLPDLNMRHISKMTTQFGMIQFAKINQPDRSSGFTLDDNARALISMLMHYAMTDNADDLKYITTYLDFIGFCQTSDGRFLNYVDENQSFTAQNHLVNLDDSNGRAIWALGFTISHRGILPEALVSQATLLMNNALEQLASITSTRAIAFSLKGLLYFHQTIPLASNVQLATHLANKIERMYIHEAEPEWEWFESYLTYGNSILSEGMLCAYQITNNYIYKTIAKSSFDFLLSRTFNKNGIKLISNVSWFHKGLTVDEYGEQPIDVAYTILALGRFYDVFDDQTYMDKMKIAFDWFQGKNHLGQIIYNPRTGGCYDGLEQYHVNLNQGAESTVSYLMSRLTTEQYQITNYIREQQLALTEYKLEYITNEV